MKVLWITNALLPDALAHLTKEKAESNSTGSWIVALSEALRNNQNIELFIASATPLVEKLSVFNVNNITYYAIPKVCHVMQYSKKYENYMTQIKEQVRPDVVHIHGTERPFGLSYVRSCGNQHVVASIQGMPSVIADYYLAGLSKYDCLSNMSFHDLVMRNNPISVKRKMQKCGQYEVELISEINHVMGRTTWDKAHCYSINTKINYHHCDETLRLPFYDGQWHYDKCDKNTIFVSQASYPLKGFHILLKALPIVIKQIPDLKVVVAGHNVTKIESIKDYFKIHSYGFFLKNEIKKRQLGKYIYFTGSLNADQMKEQMLQANVFVSCSSIENSPNSLGEAQILGLPCVASNVGGVMDFIPSEKCGLMYRFEDYAMLAYQIVRAIQNSKTFDNTEMVYSAKKRHDYNTILHQLLITYEKVSKNE